MSQKARNLFKTEESCSKSEKLLEIRKVAQKWRRNLGTALPALEKSLSFFSQNIPFFFLQYVASNAQNSMQVVSGDVPEVLSRVTGLSI